MYYMSQDGKVLAEGDRLYIDGNAIFAVVSGGEDIKLAEYEIYGEAQEMLHKVYAAIEDGENVFSFE